MAGTWSAPLTVPRSTTSPGPPQLLRRRGRRAPVVASRHYGGKSQILRPSSHRRAFLQFGRAFSGTTRRAPGASPTTPRRRLMAGLSGRRRGRVVALRAAPATVAVAPRLPATTQATTLRVASASGGIALAVGSRASRRPPHRLVTRRAGHRFGARTSSFLRSTAAAHRLRLRPSSRRRRTGHRGAAGRRTAATVDRHRSSRVTRAPRTSAPGTSDVRRSPRAGLATCAAAAGARVSGSPRPPTCTPRVSAPREHRGATVVTRAGDAAGRRSCATGARRHADAGDRHAPIARRRASTLGRRGRRRFGASSCAGRRRRRPAVAGGSRRRAARSSPSSSACRPARGRSTRRRCDWGAAFGAATPSRAVAAPRRRSPAAGDGGRVGVAYNDGAGPRASSARRAERVRAAGTLRAGEALPRHHLRVPDERARLRAHEGHARVARLRARRRSSDDADLILFNTCSIREKADERFSRTCTAPSALKAARPGASSIGVGGCWAQSVKERGLPRSSRSSTSRSAPARSTSSPSSCTSDSLTAQGYFEFEGFTGHLPAQARARLPGVGADLASAATGVLVLHRARRRAGARSRGRSTSSSPRSRGSPPTACARSRCSARTSTPTGATCGRERASFAELLHARRRDRRHRPHPLHVAAPEGHARGRHPRPRRAGVASASTSTCRCSRARRRSSRRCAAPTRASATSTASR